MFEKKFEDRLKQWYNFRYTLTTAPDPIQSAIDFWNQVPVSYRNIDPYEPTTWPNPWEMIEENSYCEYTKILAVAYTLKLTEQFKEWRPVFKIGIDKRDSRMYYMLFVKDKVLSFDSDKSIQITQVPNDIHIQKVIELPELY